MNQKSAGLFEPRKIGEMAPATKVLLYAVLIGWSVFVIFPIYWLFITSFKTPAAVNEGPFFIPWVDFQPSLHAWKDLFIYDAADTFRAYFNSIVIAASATVLS
ncbi:MAG: carbohydrate ABC transporter permease, partial [Pseudomonadota bacterium]